MGNDIPGNSANSQLPQSTNQAPGGEEHLLLTVLGTNPRQTRYVLDNQEPVEAKLAPVALLNLLPHADTPDRVMAICTPEAQESSWPLLESALAGRCQADLVPVSSGDGEDDVNTFLACVAEAVPAGAEITVDVTHGFRHFSFLTYIAVLYLAALRDVRVRGAYYGLLNQDEPSRFLDLRPLLKLPGWIHALQVLDETGSTLPLAKALRDGSCGQNAEAIARDLQQLSQGYLSGLPLELGKQAHSICEQKRGPLRKLLEDDHRLPLSEELVDDLGRILKPFALVNPPAAGTGRNQSKEWKRHVPLNEDELRRQARIIDDLLERENVATALRLMDEWTVSWVVWRVGDKGQWLDYDRVRRPAANRLKAIPEDCDLKNNLSEELLDLRDYWQVLSKLRNAYAHHGMRPGDLTDDAENRKKIDGIHRYWKETLCQFPSFSLSLGTE